MRPCEDPCALSCLRGLLLDSDDSDGSKSLVMDDRLTYQARQGLHTPHLLSQAGPAHASPTKPGKACTRLTYQARQGLHTPHIPSQAKPPHTSPTKPGKASTRLACGTLFLSAKNAALHHALTSSAALDRTAYAKQACLPWTPGLGPARCVLVLTFLSGDAVPVCWGQV